MKLNELIEDYSGSLAECDITSVTDDTRKVEKGSLFFCVKGAKFDGHTSASEMLEKGAVAVVCEHDLGLGERQIITENSRRLYGKACSAWFGHPERKLKMIGVTGTNGKTTTTNIIKHILMQNGHKTGLVGTIQNEIGDEILHTDNTTPFAFDFMALLDRMVKSGCEYVVMEVSSFGLVQNRIGSSHFDVALFTNLTQDHLDYHKDMEDYYQAKKLLFSMCDTALCNIDDSYGKRLYSEISCNERSFSVEDKADFRAENISIKASGSYFDLCYNGKSYPVKTNMTGMFNISNVLGAVAVCIEEGIPVDDIISAVGNYKGVKGRCEIIPTGKDFTVICDYAHTPDALENVLRSLKPYAENRLVCLFGCGGNRDSAKRPKMARSASEYADKLIVTSDNPRDENPKSIINEVLTGLAESSVPYDVVTDRREAIYHALKTAEKGDIIVLAGKGHEDYQILENNRHIHFDEREVVADGLKLL
ncbi:MAG: UDP-N-acetylmuramoyl-L-alanyl-D-glutamate--2,6-diaminopimelate ligase [Ruminococcus flavefaciens]|nr:UDP-N-acetylmuramoyl-L-alanyl-D-glutamate--2,6-diaminopimelate ligase [Ruminococcus flavefaciens]